MKVKGETISVTNPILMLIEAMCYTLAVTSIFSWLPYDGEFLSFPSNVLLALPFIGYGVFVRMSMHIDFVCVKQLMYWAFGLAPIILVVVSVLANTSAIISFQMSIGIEIFSVVALNIFGYMALKGGET